MTDLKITLIQTNLHWEDKEKNLEMFTEKISSIREETDIIVLPEMFSTGFTMNAKKMAENMNGISVSWMKEISEIKNCVVTGSLIIEEDGKYFNRLIWMQPDGFDFYDKRHLFSYAGEDKTYSQGKNKILKAVKGWKVMPLVCYDLRFPVWSRRSKENDFDFLIYVANWPEKRIFAWQQLLIARAIENQCYVAGLNRTGNDGNDFYHSGESAVLNFLGENVLKMNANEEFVHTSTLSKDDLENFRKQFAFFQDGDEFNIV